MPGTILAVQFAGFSTAHAWGNGGHKVICRIAYEELSPSAETRVDALIAIDTKFRTFAESCPWTDIFPRVRPPEHYVNIPRMALGLDAGHPCPEAERCVVSAILTDARDLAFASEMQDQLMLLKSLGHWVGDIHQPLHVSAIPTGMT